MSFVAVSAYSAEQGKDFSNLCLNGKYEGLLNVRETSGKQYVKTHFGYDDEEIDMFEHGCGEGKYQNSYGYTQICGTQDALNALYELSRNSANSENIEKILNLLDIDEYINYMASELYMDNGDWEPNTNNLKGWRPREENGRFPDGGTNCYVMTRPSIDAPNRLSYYTQLFDEEVLRTEFCHPTRIEPITLEDEIVVYDLQGRRIPQDDVLPTIYIRNGKKYLNIQ